VFCGLSLSGAIPYWLQPDTRPDLGCDQLWFFPATIWPIIYGNQFRMDWVMIETVWPSFPQVKMFMKLCFHHNSVNSQPISLTFGVICSWKIGTSNATNSPVHNQLQPVFYWLLFMSNLHATATTTDPDPGKPDLKSSLLQSIFVVQSSPVASPYDQTFKHYI
jgi:hypothetical protein